MGGRRCGWWVGLAFTVLVAGAGAQPRVIGGEAAPDGAYPWMAALVEPGTDAYLGQFCGGVLVHPRWVLTAAHCFADGSQTRVDPSQPVDVVIGRDDLWFGSGGIRLASRRAVVHPGFELSRMDGDLALVELSAAVPITPVRVMGQTYDQPLLAPGTPALGLGWGDTDISPGATHYPTHLYQVEVPVVDNSACGTSIAGVSITDDMICAGLAQGGKDTCQGDSGGPLLVRGAHGEWLDAGITSFGEGCAQPRLYGVYTRLSRYAGWISDTVCTAQEKPAAPRLRLSANGTTISVDFDAVAGAEGYRLYYAPYPGGTPVGFTELGGQRHASADLPRGSAYYGAVVAYRGNCLSPLSNIASVSVQ